MRHPPPARHLLLSTLAIALTACGVHAPRSGAVPGPEPGPTSVSTSSVQGGTDEATRPETTRPETTLLETAFFERLAAHCGRAYVGRVTVDEPATAQSPFAGKPVVMHLRSCDADTIRIPLHVGQDRSRTWVITRTPTGLRLKHDHRHEDGTPDRSTMYGGDADPVQSVREADGALQVAFPVDAESIAGFTANGLTASVTNTWTLTLGEGRFVYGLSRPGGRRFRLEFDLTRPVPSPPPPWGATDGG